MKEDINNTSKETSEDIHAMNRFPVSFAIFSLARSHRGLASQLLREVGLFAGQEIILMQLWTKDGQSQSSLGRIMQLDHSTVAKSVRRMEESGLVKRSRSEEDGRVTIVSLTKAGWDLETKVLDIWSRLENTTTEGLAEQESKLLESITRKITSNIDSIIMS